MTSDPTRPEPWALTVIDRFSDTASPSETFDRASAFFAGFADGVLCHSVVSPATGGAVTATTDLADDLVHTFRRALAAHHDPLAQHALNRTDLLVVDVDRDQDPANAALTRVLRDLGFAGLMVQSVPIPGAAGAVAYLFRSREGFERVRRPHLAARFRMAAMVFNAAFYRGRRIDDPVASGGGQRFDFILTRRERAALAHLAEGCGTAEIASAMGISVTMVKRHLTNAREKLGANTRTQSVAIAVACGLI